MLLINLIFEFYVLIVQAGCLALCNLHQTFIPCCSKIAKFNLLKTKVEMKIVPVNIGVGSRGGGRAISPPPQVSSWGEGGIASPPPPPQLYTHCLHNELHCSIVIL